MTTRDLRHYTTNLDLFDYQRTPPKAFQTSRDFVVKSAIKDGATGAVRTGVPDGRALLEIYHPSSGGGGMPFQTLLKSSGININTAAIGAANLSTAASKAATGGVPSAFPQAGTGTGAQPGSTTTAPQGGNTSGNGSPPSSVPSGGTLPNAGVGGTTAPGGGTGTGGSGSGGSTSPFPDPGSTTTPPGTGTTPTGSSGGGGGGGGSTGGGSGGYMGSCSLGNICQIAEGAV